MKKSEAYKIAAAAVATLAWHDVKCYLSQQVIDNIVKIILHYEKEWENETV